MGTRRKSLLLLLCLASCDSCNAPPLGSSPNSTAAPVDPTALKLSIVYGSEKKTWFDEEVKRFVDSGAKTKSGKKIAIDARAMGSGEMLQGIVSGELKPHVFSPASSAYISLLNQSWMQKSAGTKPISPSGDPVVLSPLVIAMWKPMAEALGWPKKSIGWSDLLAVGQAADGWATRGHPEWGSFKLGHTHPEYSNSGLLSVLAEAYAGAKKARGIATADLDKPGTRQFIERVENSIVHYGKSTGFFSDKMIERGPAYLSAAVLYENLVIESYAKSNAPFPIVSIYPVEGTFWSDHPYAILDGAWVGAEEREAAQAFLAFLKAKPQQERALALGFRPAEPSIPVGSPIDQAHGADAKQPQTLLEVPDAPTLQKLIEVWSATKKSTDVILVFDKSGSMDGQPLREAKTGAKAFIDSLTPRDEVSLLFFDSRVLPVMGPYKISDGKTSLLQSIDNTIAEGGTSLYDATAAAYAVSKKRADADKRKIHALVVMTDGRDENSAMALEALERSFKTEGQSSAPVKVFTIAYGQQAETKVLSRIAEAAQGSSAKGSTSTIVQVYRDMAAFF